MSIEWDIEELAGYAMGKSEDEVEDMINNFTTDDELFEKYKIDLERYSAIVKDLLPFTPKVQAGITKDLYHAFVVGIRMIVKQKIV